jgi:hypothetical protein
MKISKHLYALAIAGAVFSAQAQSISNLQSTTAGSVATYDNGFFIPSGSPGPSHIDFIFEVGASSFQISDISLALAGNSAGSGSFTLSLWSANSSGVPQAQLQSQTLTYTVGSSGPPDAYLNVFTSSDLGSAFTGQTLNSGDKYAIRLNGAATFTVGWQGYNLSTYNYTSSGINYVDSIGWSGPAGYGFGIGINTAAPTPVPEASGSVAGLGLAMAGLYQLRRRKAAVGKLSVES